MKNLIKLVPILILIICIGCKQKEQQLEKDNKVLILYCNGCEEESEILSDLEYSTEANEEFLKKNLVEVRFDTITKKCGYKLIWNNKSKEIESALSDIDLQNEMKTFFEVK